MKLFTRTVITWLLLCGLSTITKAADELPDDENLVQRIAQTFANSAEYQSALVQVHSERGFILLTGQVLTEEARTQATNTVVFASQDIRRIINELIVVDAIDTTTLAADESMAAAILADLASMDEALAATCRVVVHRSVVYLMGAFGTEAQQQIAERVSRFPGVASIKTAFEFQGN